MRLWSGNRRRVGHVYQGRFKSFPVEADDHFYQVARYVERNPVHAGLVEWAEEFPWSSAAAHCSFRPDDMLSDPCDLTLDLTPKKWRQWLREPWEDQDEMVARLRECTHTGRPAGGKSFLTRLEGDCTVPMAVHLQELGEGRIRVRGLLASLDGKRIVRAEEEAAAADAESLGRRVAEAVLSGGGEEILEEIERQG